MINYKLPSNLDKDINKLKDLLAKHKEGQVSAAEVKAYRVPFGVYEQRKFGTYMVRIRCAAGFITPHQLERIAQISSRYAAGKLHLTSRQELQIHYVKLDDVISIIEALKEVGLASKGGGGNTVRNVIASECAGIDRQEEFDVTPFVFALTTRLIAEEDSWTLPRKLKIAFSGSSLDKGYATIADLGFIAKVKDGQKGFKVYVAGGMGAKPAVGNLFFDFVPQEQVYNIAKAIKSLFWKYGNRKNKHAARLRFLWQSLGEQEFRNKFNQEYEQVKKENHLPLELEQVNNFGVEPNIVGEKPQNLVDFEVWKNRFVKSQVQVGLFSIIVPIKLGFIENEKAQKLAEFLKPFGENVIRLSKDQNFLIRNIPQIYLSNVFNFLNKTLDNFNRPLICDRLLSCAGSSTCQLGICLSREASKVIIKGLQESKLDLDKISNLKINISGCPNSCGHHHAADLGFFGKADRINDKLYPAYNVVAGAIIRDGQTKFAKIVGQISAKALPELVVDFLKLYLSKAENYEDFQEYIQNDGKDDLNKICGNYKNSYSFKDWGSQEEFSLAGRGTGECAASLADLTIEEIQNLESMESEESIIDKSSGTTIKDLRGVACPMNFVKTKIELSKLQSKGILEIWLDDGDPIENVPGSVREEGHKILGQVRKDNYWKVTIEKK